jgi:hypothetical protein
MTDRKYSIWFGRNENFEGSERFLGVLWFMDQKRKYENTKIRESLFIQSIKRCINNNPMICH